MPTLDMRVWPCAVLLALCLLAAGPAQAQVFSAGDCRAALSPEDRSGFRPLPQGELFCSLLADPKAPRSFASALHGSAGNFPSQIGAVGIGDRFGVFRWGRVQLDLFGAVFSQFDLGAPSFDLVNADYLVGLPLTLRYRGFSGRLRAYHQSSHLGDEFLLRSQVDRENLSFESIELLLSQKIGPVRLYGGGERLLSPSPDDLSDLVGHGGVELRPGAALLRVGMLGSARLVGAADVKLIEEQDWEAGVSLRAGFEVSRSNMPAVPVSRWQLLFEYYDGPTPYGQFFRRDLTYWGVGIHFTR
jgi:hypothetical protein